MEKELNFSHSSQCSSHSSPEPPLPYNGPKTEASGNVRGRGDSANPMPSLPSTPEPKLSQRKCPLRWAYPSALSDKMQPLSSPNLHSPTWPSNLKPHSSPNYGTHSLNMFISSQERFPHNFSNIGYYFSSKSEMHRWKARILPPHPPKTWCPLEINQALRILAHRDL